MILIIFNKLIFDLINTLWREPMQILLVEDDKKLGKFTKLMLESKGHVVTWVLSGNDAIDYLEADLYEIMILDWMLPDITGLEVIRILRNRGNVLPVIMMTAKGTLEDKVSGFNAGADDYIVKPFEFDELNLRILALGRRLTGRIQNEFSYESFLIDYNTHLIEYENRALELTRKEYLLLKLLIEHKGGIVSKEQIIDHLYTIDDIVTDNAIEALIRRIRTKIGSEISPYIIKVVRNMGYRLIKDA
ncbi:response regulator transcription factor [Macrococcoides canis]|nr:response regulator transcription factor [Macrococcus canis]